jgi:hypothetical protein
MAICLSRHWRREGSLFRTFVGRVRKRLTGDPHDPRRMIVRRALKAGITRLASGLPASPYVLNGGLLEYAQQMLAHESARTTNQPDASAAAYLQVIAKRPREALTP